MRPYPWLIVSVLLSGLFGLAGCREHEQTQGTPLQPPPPPYQPVPQEIIEAMERLSGAKVGEVRAIVNEMVTVQVHRPEGIAMGDPVAIIPFEQAATLAKKLEADPTTRDAREVLSRGTEGRVFRAVEINGQPRLIVTWEPASAGRPPAERDVAIVGRWR